MNPYFYRPKSSMQIEVKVAGRSLNGKKGQKVRGGVGGRNMLEENFPLPGANDVNLDPELAREDSITGWGASEALDGGGFSRQVNYDYENAKMRFEHGDRYQTRDRRAGSLDGRLGTPS